jgi:hypothetical protein
MAKQVRDLVDGASLPDELCREAVAYQVGAGDAGNLNPASLQSRTHNPRNGAAGSERTDRRHIGQKHSLTVDPWSRMQHILGERGARFLQERHDPIAPCLGTAHKHFGGAPADILKLKRSQLLVAQAGRGEQKQKRAVPNARRRRHVDRVNHAPDIFPRKPRRHVRQPVARSARDEPSKILVVEAGPLKETQECTGARRGR